MIKHFYYATENPSKHRSMRRVLKPYNVNLVARRIDFQEPEARDVQLVAEIAKKKAKKACELLGQEGLLSSNDWLIAANDTGFDIEALGGWPGAMVRRELKETTVEDIIEKMRGETNRRCTFVESMAIILPGFSEPFVFTHKSPGVIDTKVNPLTEDMKEIVKSPLWQIFIPDESKVAVSLMTMEQHEAWFERSGRRKHSSEQQVVNWMVEKGYIESKLRDEGRMRRIEF